MHPVSAPPRPPTGRTARAGTRPLAWAVLVTAVLQALAPAVTIAGPGSSPGGGSGPDLLLTPAGWAFSIWGLIYALAIAQAGLVLVRGAGTVPRLLQVAQVALHLGAAVWILLAGLDSSVATAGALLAMFAAAVTAVLTTTRHRFPDRLLELLTRAAVGLYAGWVTAAVFLNVSTALVDAGPAAADSPGWQLVVLVLASATLLGLTLATGLVPYAVAGAWAMVGIAATGTEDGSPAVVALALVAVALLLAAALVVGRRAAPVSPGDAER